MYIMYYWKWIIFLSLFREREHGGGAVRRRERILSRLCSVSAEPEAGLELTNSVRSWPELKWRACHLMDWATEVAQMWIISCKVKILFWKIVRKKIFFLSLFILREREGENLKQAPCHQGVLISWTMRSWPEQVSRVGGLAAWATQMPQIISGLFLKFIF